MFQKASADSSDRSFSKSAPAALHNAGNRRPTAKAAALQRTPENAHSAQDPIAPTGLNGIRQRPDSGAPPHRGSDTHAVSLNLSLIGRWADGRFPADRHN
jgi:hypothetical protein